MEAVLSFENGEVQNHGKRIKILFRIGIAITVLTGLSQIIRGILSSFGGGFLVISKLIILVVGPLITRVYCEPLFVFFKIHETLQDMKKNQDREKAV